MCNFILGNLFWDFKSIFFINTVLKPHRTLFSACLYVIRQVFVFISSRHALNERWQLLTDRLVIAKVNSSTCFTSETNLESDMQGSKQLDQRNDTLGEKMSCERMNMFV